MITTDNTKEMVRGATFSECRKYRYVLWRIWDDTLPKVMFIGLNPSSANEDTDDATIRNVIALSKFNGFGSVYMLNCFPYISTNPNDLNDFGNTEENDYAISNYYFVCEEVV